MRNGVSFEYAIETASCHFGLTAGTSCISAAWERPGEWAFASAERDDRSYAQCSVGKKTGSLVPCPPLYGTEALEAALASATGALEVPWKYLAESPARQRRKTRKDRRDG